MEYQRNQVPRHGGQGYGNPHPYPHPQPQAHPGFYPNVQQGPPMRRPPPPDRPSSGLAGIRVTLKPEFCMAQPPMLLPVPEDIPPSNFQFDFSVEKKILEEAKKGYQGYDLDILSDENEELNSAMGVEDPVIMRYIGMGLDRDAVTVAVATYGDVQAKVLQFVPSYKFLREMGFPSEKIAEALSMSDNDKERALTHLVQ